jgi:hypothetical protein
MKITKSQLNRIIQEELNKISYLFEDDRICAKESDGCTNFPDGNILRGSGDEWRHCCVDHDCCYDRGGDENDRLRCDEKLRSCVNKTGGPGNLMFIAVQQYGQKKFNTKKKITENIRIKRSTLNRIIKEALREQLKRI